MNKYSERFLSKICKTNSCWMWAGVVSKSGYGMFYNGIAMVYSHRYSYELHKGLIKPGFYICHSCDVKTCVNPDHLWEGTASENMKDCSRKGRLYSYYREGGANGSKNIKSKLTEIDVSVIRFMLSQGELGSAIAKQFKVSTSTISKIKLNQCWI